MFTRSIVVLFFCVNSVLAGTRIYFSKCGVNGFTCRLNGTKIIDVKYECPKNVNDVVIYINQFSSPPTIEKLEIANCHTLTLSTRCSSESKRIRLLSVSNIQHLTFQRVQYEPMLPPTVIFRNISNIPVIPFRTFAQIEKAYYSAGCYAQPADFQNLYFEKVSVDVIQPNAFASLNQFKTFSFVDVKVKTIQYSGIRVRQDLTGVFEIKNSNIGVIEHLGIQVYTKRAIFSESQIKEIASGSINGTVEDFFFNDNFVETVHPYGFSMLATNVFILKNSFLHLKSGALEKLSPGLMQDSGRNFGKLKFIYDFSKNTLNFVDAGSLNPDYSSYENVQTDMMFSRNKLLCSCENLGWLFSTLGHGPTTAQLEPFYEMVLDESYANTCSDPADNPCDLPLRRVGELVRCGKCLTNVTMEYLCEENKTGKQSTAKMSILNFTEPENIEELTNFNNEEVVVSSATSYINMIASCTLVYLFTYFP